MACLNITDAKTNHLYKKSNNVDANYNVVAKLNTSIHDMFWLIIFDENACFNESMRLKVCYVAPHKGSG